MRLDPAVVGFGMILPSIAAWLYFVVYSGHELMQTVYSICKSVQFGLPVVWVIGCLGVRARPQRPHSRGMLAAIVFGLAAGAAGICFYLVALRTNPVFAPAFLIIQEKVRGMKAATPFRFVMLAAFISVIHSLLEEYYFRWFIFGRLRTLTNFPVALALSSLAFMAHHVIVVGAYFNWTNWPMSLFLCGCVAVGGAAWAWLYERAGSLYSPWVSHCIVDVAIMIVGYDMLWGLFP